MSLAKYNCILYQFCKKNRSSKTEFPRIKPLNFDLDSLFDYDIDFPFIFKFSWKVQDESPESDGSNPMQSAELWNLQPFTRYAVYVQAYKLFTENVVQNYVAQTKVEYFTTKAKSKWKTSNCPYETSRTPCEFVIFEN